MAAVGTAPLRARRAGAVGCFFSWHKVSSVNVVNGRWDTGEDKLQGTRGLERSRSHRTPGVAVSGQDGSFWHPSDAGQCGERFLSAGNGEPAWAPAARGRGLTSPLGTSAPSLSEDTPVEAARQVFSQ